MQYKKSTSTIGFKSRSTANEAKELASKATALDKQRRETVKEFAATSSDQLKEMQRIDGLRTQIDNYEISNLKEFNKAFTGLIDTAAEELGSKYIAAKNQEGIDLHRRYEAGDEEAIAIIDGNEKQIAELDEKLAELQKAAELKGQELDKAALAEERVSLENKLRALNIRKLGTNVAYGFSQAALVEGAEGFMPWFMDATRTRTDQIPGEEFTVADYDKLTNSVQRDQVEDYLLNEYIEQVNANIGASSKLVNSFLTKSVVKQLTKWKSGKLADEEQNFANDQLEGWKTNIFTNAKKYTADDNQDIEGSKLKLAKALETYAELGPSAHFRAGTSGSSNAATKNGIIDTVEAIFDETDDANDIESLREFFATTKISIGNLGTKTLEEHFPADFNLNDIIFKSEVKRAQKAENTQLLLKKQFKEEEHQLKELLALGPDDGGIDQTEFENRLLGMNKKYANWYEYDTSINTLRTFVPEYVTPSKSHQIASKALKEDDFIPFKTYLQLHPSVREQYKDKVDFDKFVNTPASTQKLETYKEDIDSALDLVYVNDSTNPSIKGKDPRLTAVKTYALNSIPSVALKLKKASNTEAPVQDFYDQAFQIVRDDILNAKNSASTYFIDSNETFNERLLQKAGFPTEKISVEFNEKVKFTEENLVEAYKIINSTTGDAFSMEGVQLFGKMDKTQAEVFFQPKKNDAGEIVGLNSHFMEIQKYDPYNRDAYTLFNLARKSYGLDPIDFSEALPNSVIELQNKLKNASPAIKALFKTGDMKSIARGFDKLNIAYVPVLSDAIVSHIPIDEIVIPTNVVTEILAREDVNFTLDDYNSSIETKNQVLRIHVNDLLKEAATKSENKHVQIRMVATAISGNKMEDWISTKNEVIGTRVLNTYLTGDLGDGDSEGSVDLTNYNKVIFSSQEIKTLATPVTIEDLNNKLNALDNEIPSKYIQRYFIIQNGKRIDVPEGTPGAQTLPFLTKYNEEWGIHKEQVDKLNAQKRVIQAIAEPGRILWGIDQRSDANSKQLMYDIRAVIGDDRYKALQQKVDSMNLGYKSGERAIENPLALVSTYKKGVSPYAQEFYNLLLQEPEFFYVGDNDG